MIQSHDNFKRLAFIISLHFSLFSVYQPDLPPPMIHPEQQAIEAMKDLKDIEDTKAMDVPSEAELVHPPTSPQQVVCNIW